MARTPIYLLSCIVLGLAVSCRDTSPEPIAAPVRTPPPPAAVLPPAQPLPAATALPANAWGLESLKPDGTVATDGDAIVIRRGTHGAEAYMSRGYRDLEVHPGGQYLFRYTAQSEGNGNGRTFCYIGKADGTWDEKHLTWGPLVAPGPAGAGYLPVVVPLDGVRTRLCVAAEGAETASRFSGLSLQEVIPPLVLSPATGAVTLDGRLDDALWSQAAVLAPMRVIGDIGRSASLATEARIAVQDGWLWLAVRCPEPDPARIRTSEKDNFAIFADDCIEVYVSKDQNEYSQVVVNASGKHGWKRMNRPVEGRSWHPVCTESLPGTIESAARIDRAGKVWTCEMRLRLADIYGGQPGGRTPLYFNVVRHRPETSEEYVSWSLLPGQTNHDPHHFAAAVLDLPGAPAAAPVAAAMPQHLSMTSSLGIPEVLLGATPVRMATADTRFPLPATLRIANRADIDAGVLADAQAALRVADGGTAELTLAIDPAALDDPALDAAQRKRLAGPEAYRLALAGTTATISGRSQAGVLRGLATLMVMAERARIASRDLPGLAILDAPASPVRGWLLHDHKPISVTRQAIDVAFRLRLSHLLISVDSFNGETGFPFASAPIGDPTRTVQEWVDAFAYARARGIEPVPYISSWSRVQYITRLPQYRHLAVSEPKDNEHRNLDIAQPEAERLMLALQADLIAALKPKIMCIAFDEIHFSPLVTSEAARAKHWKSSDWVVEALTVNADFLRPQGIRMWLWGDMLDPDQNGRQLDQSGPALLARLPKDMTILDWKYESDFDGAADFPSVGMFTGQGLQTIGCPWFLPNNVAAFAGSVQRHGGDGMIQTSWCSTYPQNMQGELERALSLTARLSWSPADADLPHLTTLPEAPFAFALPRREAALGPARAPRPLTATDGLAAEGDVAKLLGWPGASLDFLSAPVTSVRQLKMLPFHRDGRPAALMARPGATAAIAIGAPVRALTFLHAATPRILTGEMHKDMKMVGEDLGAYLVHYTDGSSERIPLAYRINIGASNDPILGHAQDPAIFGTVSERAFVDISSHTWLNPHPERAVGSVELVAGPNPETATLLFALSAE